MQVFKTWCREQVRTAFPATGATVAAFVDEMGRIKTPATVRRYTSSIATVHKALRETNPLDSAAVRFARCNGCTGGAGAGRRRSRD